MRRIVVAMDSFKGSVSSEEAGEAVRAGILRAMPGVQVDVCPLADGGEGTVEALLAACGGEEVRVSVCDPLAREREAVYGILPDGTAVIEMAQAAGLPLLAENERDPLTASTYGVGQMLLDAAERGCRHMLLGIGGSATNDGGAGMLQALGVSLLDREGRAIPRGAEGLSLLERIEMSSLSPLIAACTFEVACDVTSPLCGEQGASAVFGPQKGAEPAQIPRMDSWLARFADLTEQVIPGADPDIPGSGAAGGMGFALRSYLHAELIPGLTLIARQTGLAERIADCDLVVTGEGRLDGQSVMGKTPVGVARMAREHGIPVLAIAGSVAEGAARCHEQGIDAYFPILPGPMTLSEALMKENARRSLARTAEEAMRLWNAARRKGGRV